MVPVVRITHKPTNKVREFDNLREAGAWIVEYEKNKYMKVEDLEIQAPIDLSAFAPHIPEWASYLFLAVENEYGGGPNNRIVPKIRFSSKPYRRVTTGRTFFTDRTWTKIDHISIIAGYDDGDTRGVILHEMAHTIVKAGHTRNFWRRLFIMVRKYMSYDDEIRYVKREEGYKKSSRYWYAEMYNITEVLSQYKQRVERPARKTAAQKSAEAFSIMFGKEQ